MFQLTEEEVKQMVSQNAIPSKQHLGGSLPYAFTEQGVANIASVLTSKKAIEVNIQIMRAFVALRKFILSNAQVFQRLDSIELKQITYDKNFEKVFNALETHEKKQGIFYEGQMFDAYIFVCNIVKKVKKEIVLVDNYIDESVLTSFSKRKENVKVTIYTKNISRQLVLDIKKFNSQYNYIEVKEFNNSHDRFMIIDNQDIYHFGASLKDMGKKWFAFSRFQIGAVKMLNKLK